MIVIGRVPKLLPLNKVTENRIVTEKIKAAEEAKKTPEKKKK